LDLAGISFLKFLPVPNFRGAKASQNVQGQV
jgi:hypothetical protein